MNRSEALDRNRTLDRSGALDLSRTLDRSGTRDCGRPWIVVELDIVVEP